ncbi:MAG: prepilin-type N-terminal cleavage/methylation domain-containing protein [Candidatus Omnitrophica bacterium]|nr:prepilin-type N-terminal cleavage/methylation domain-containing protein [Candidatus Omnitrophota bacterium]
MSSRRGGFTLIELMIAILLLVGGVAAATFAMSRGMFAAADTETLEQAVALAQERMENLRGTAFASIANEAKAAVSSWTGFSRQVDITQPAGTNANFKQVVVTVYWTPGAAELSTSLTSYVANVNNN